MLTKNDCMSILVSLEDAGVDINQPMRKLVVSSTVPVDVLKFIAANRGIEAINFYEVLRKKHNKSGSKLYTNILKDNISEDELLTTLSNLLLQIFLYRNNLETGKELFLKEIRATEILAAINAYLIDYNIDPCVKLMQLIKSDLLVLEYLNGRRERE